MYVYVYTCIYDPNVRVPKVAVFVHIYLLSFMHPFTPSITDSIAVLPAIPPKLSRSSRHFPPKP